MGVPALFRWLSAKYPKIVERVVEEARLAEDGSEQGVNLLGPNPNGFEVDNLYLDMNGIIHPCCHPMDKAAPATEEDMMIEIFKYLDRIFSMIRPRRLLFMAIDGVAPRAKMNQQRSRRFRAAKERREKAEKETQIRDELGEENDPSEEGGDDDFDSNCITPGTKFMALVAESIRYYVVERINRAPAWRSVKVIFSDANVPGEGEHKIVDYIRRQRLDPDYDPATRHVIYGLDADLIMLSMATHEPFFRVLREDVFWEEQVKYNPCSYCGIKGHAADACSERAKNDPNFKLPPIQEKPFIFLDVAVLREYLDAELRPSYQLPFKWDLERAIDDWIFMCFFVGNDFLPHLPCLEIREGAVDILIESYKANLGRMGGFICHNGSVNLARAQYILDDIGKVEENIFQKRKEKEDRRDANIKRRKLADAERDLRSSSNPKASSGEFIAGKDALQQMREANLAAAEAFKAQLQASMEDDEPVDDVRLWERGAKDRYYQKKFHIEPDNKEFINNVVRSYVEGLCWVMAYYYQGCPSWKWFYPYHFAPFASDLGSIGDLDIQFELGEPFRPFDQLMGVFPADSKNLVPEPFRKLMTSEDSEVIDFYPTDFAIDLNGKKQAWQGVVLLPFIDETRLLSALEKIYPELEDADQKMNTRGEDRVYFSIWHPFTRHLLQRLEETNRHFTLLNPEETDGLAGSIMKNEEFPDLGGSYLSPLPDQGCPDVNDLQVCCFVYFVPYHDRKHLKHKATLLPDAQLPPRILTEEDISAVQSGLASRRFPGRLQLDRPPPPGQHSMHQEYSREYQQRDSGQRWRQHEERRYEERRDQFQRDRPDNFPPPPKYPPPMYPPPMMPPSAIYPPPGGFHRGPPPERKRHIMDDLYGRYPPPSN